MSWYDPTSWFDDAPADTDLTPQAESAGFTSQADYDQYVLEQSQQTLYVAGGGGADQVTLGEGIVQESLGRYTLATSLNAARAESAPYLFGADGSLGSALTEARAGLNFTRDVIQLSQEAQAVTEPYQVGTGRNAVTVIPSGTGSRGVLAGTSGVASGGGGLTADDARQLMLSAAAGLALAFVAKKLLAAA